MTGHTTRDGSLFSEIHGLVMVCLEGGGTASQFELLDNLVHDNPVARRLYVQYLSDSMCLRCIVPTLGENGIQDVASAAAIDADSFVNPSLHSPLRVPSPAFGFLSPTLHPTLGSVSGWTISYLSSAVITGLLILGFWLMPVSRPEQVARNAEPSVVEPKAYVGRITGMVDCKIGDSRVSLGQKLDLASGLMEITYDTGAKVILQGPVTYSVEANGGYLAVGKLTGKLEKKVAGGSNPQSPIPNPFMIHTPTATVTDLGTEFGVEVDREKAATETQVFLGAIKVIRSRDESDNAVEQIVRAGSAVRLDGKSKHIVVVRPGDRKFTRTLPRQAGQTEALRAEADQYAKLVLSMSPTAYYRMDEWPKTDKKDCSVLVDSSPGGHHGVVHWDRAFGESRCRGKFGGGLVRHGEQASDEYAIVPNYPKTGTGQFSVSAWVWVSSDDSLCIVSDSFVPNIGRTGLGQFMFMIGPPPRGLMVLVGVSDRGATGVFKSSEKWFPKRVWQHVAFVDDGFVLRVYRNGVQESEYLCGGLIARRGGPKHLSIGCVVDELAAKPQNEIADRCRWDGYLDEIAIFNRTLSAEQVWQLFAGTAAKPTRGNAADYKTTVKKTLSKEPSKGE